MLENGARVGHYEVLKPLDKGGMGRVYLVRHTTLDAEYAMKVLNPEVAENEEYVIRFLREGRLASKIRHPNLITVHDAGQDPATGLNYLIMDYVAGGTLADLLKREKTLSVERALSIVRQVAMALAAAAEQGMVHRDIKPANIMFDRDGRVRLADLGIAKGGEDMTAVTSSESVFGTPAYMSPEQAVDSGKVDGRTDIYSLGVVLWQMLSGERPYADKTAVAIVASLLSPTPLRDIRKLRPDTPTAIVRLISDMCQKDVSRRIPSAKALLSRLDTLNGGAEDETAMTVAFAAHGTTAATTMPHGPRPLFSRPIFWLIVGGAVAASLIVVLVAINGADDSDARQSPTNEIVRESKMATRPESAPHDADTNRADAAAQEAIERERMEAAERERQEAERRRAEAERLEQERQRIEQERLVAAKKQVEQERLEKERQCAEAERKRAEAERKRLDDEAVLAASAMLGVRVEPKDVSAAKPSASVATPVRERRDPAALALAAFAAGNWPLGYQYALQDTTGNADVELWLGRCFDPSVKMPGFERHKKDSDLARKHYRLSAGKGNVEAKRALRNL